MREARRKSCGQGRRSLSGAEVRRQGQEHRAGCLDLLRLSRGFVTMRDKQEGRDPDEDSAKLLLLCRLGGSVR